MNNLKNLNSKVMLATLNISVWNGRSFDDSATRTVEVDIGAERPVGRFNKNLMPDSPESYKAIKVLENSLRKMFYTHSLEYEQLGVRLLPTNIYMDFTGKLRAMQGDFEQAVAAFIAEYPTIKANAKGELKNLYNELDYPSVDALKRKFGIKFAVLPFPDAEQFGIDLPEEELAGIRANLTTQVEHAVELARSDLAMRFYEATAKLAARAASDGRLHASAVDNVREIVDLLPKLNFTNDPKMNELADMAKRSLTTLNVEVLRESPSARMDVGEKAKEISMQMAAYMGFAPPPPEEMYPNQRVQLGLKLAA
jgi:hypothetical protein